MSGWLRKCYVQTGLLTRGILTMEWDVLWKWIAPLIYVQRRLCFGRKSFSFYSGESLEWITVFFKFLQQQMLPSLRFLSNIRRILDRQNCQIFVEGGTEFGECFGRGI